MKKRIIAAFISMVILVLSLLTAFSGCSGKEQAKEAENRDEFFSKIAGLYSSGFYDEYIYINEDGTVYVSIYNSEKIFSQLKSSLKKVYQDSEYVYHTEFSKFNKSFQIQLSENKCEYYNETEQWPTGPDPSLRSCKSNDTLYIFAPGTIIDDIPKTRYNYISIYEDEIKKDSDGKLDKYLLYSYSDKERIYPYVNDYDSDSDIFNYEKNGVWIDYTSNDSKADIYKFNSYQVDVSSLNYLDNSDNNEVPIDKENKPIYYISFGSKIFMIYENDKTVVINLTNDVDPLECTVKDSSVSEDRTFYLYHYDKIPDKQVMINDAAKAKATFSNESKR